MKDEIKEILECMEEIADCTFTTDTFELNFEDTKILLDYITNLQEENKHLNDLLDNALNEKEQLEQRIDKAIEFLDNEYNYKKGDAKFNRTDYVIWQSLKNILNGGDKDE